MSNLKMKSTKNILHAITAVTFVIGLHTFTNDDIVLKFMITDVNKRLCYLDVISLTLKKNLCECCNILVDVPTTHHQLVHRDKTSISKENWNDKVKADLLRSRFDSIRKMLKLNTDNKVTFVEFDNMKFVFPTKLNELDLIKLNIPS